MESQCAFTCIPLKTSGGVQTTEKKNKERDKEMARGEREERERDKSRNEDVFCPCTSSTQGMETLCAADMN